MAKNPNASTGSNNGNTSTQGTNLIYQQIEQDAGYYSPSIYYNLLSQHESLTLTPDTMGNDFIPVTSVTNNPDAKRKLFAIGLIPPSPAVTGRALDRSNSVAALGVPPGQTVTTSGDQSRDNQVGPGRGPAGAAGGCNGKNVSGAPGSNQGPPIVVSLSPAQLGVAIGQAYTKQFGHPPTQLELATLVSQSLRETKGQWPNNNPGYLGNIPPGSPRLDKAHTFGFVQCNNSIEYYYSYSSPQAGAAQFVAAVYHLGGQAALDAARNGDFQTYAQALHDGGYFTDTVAHYAGFAQDPRSLLDKVGDPNNLNASLLPKPINLTPAGTVDPSTSTNWNSKGASAAGQAKAQDSISANTNLNNTTTTGQKFAQAQRDMVIKTQKLLAQMANTPPLQFLVNPSSFKVNNEKVISSGSWTRSGPADVVEHWGDGQDKIDGSGKVAAFMAIDVTGQTAQGPGLTRTARHYSAAYQNFLSLYQLYRNNAGLYIDDSVDTNKMNLSVLGSIYIYFDHTLYLGSFNDFTVTETDTGPYSLEYTFSFTVRATFLLDQVSDPKHTYNIPQGGFAQRSVPTTQAATLASGNAAQNGGT